MLHSIGTTNMSVLENITEDSQPIENVKNILKMSNKYVHLPVNIHCCRKATDLNGSPSDVDDHRTVNKQVGQ